MLFTLDNIPVTDPIDWNDLSSTLKRNEELNLLVLDQQGNVTFNADGYDYIINKLNAEGFCAYVQLNVYDYCEQGNPVEIVKARLYLSDVEIDEYNCEVKLKITDDSFYALINNNKNIKATMSAPVSKNGVAIDKAFPADNAVVLIPPSDSATRKYYGVRVYEAFRLLTEFMSDGLISFASDTFDDAAKWKGLYITSGYKLRLEDTTENPTLPPFSFSELFKEINNRIPIGIIVENQFTNPVLRIESIDYFYANSTTFQFEDVEQIKTRFDTQKLYSKVKFGQPNYTDVGLAFPADIRFRGWKEEEFHILGQCNIDRTLDLTCDWHCSSNEIEAVINGYDEFDDELFLIDSVYDSPNDSINVPTNFLNLSPAKYYPNERLTNSKISERLFGGVANNIAAFFGNIGDGIFYAYLTASQTYNTTGNDGFDPCGFDATLNNVGGFYSTSTFKYTAPEAGVFSFRCNFNITITAQYTAPVIFWQLSLQRYDVTNTLVETKDAFVPNYTSGGGINYYSNSIIGSFNIGAGVDTIFVMNDGDYITVRLLKNLGGFGDIDYTIEGGNQTFFECYDNTVGGGDFQIYNSDDFPIQIHEFEYKMTLAEFQGILNNQRSSYAFYTDIDNIRFGWISEIKYNHYKGTANVKLITDRRSQSNGNRISS